MNQHTTRFYPSSNRLTAALLVVLVSGFGLFAHIQSEARALDADTSSGTYLAGSKDNPQNLNRTQNNTVTKSI